MIDTTAGLESLSELVRLCSTSGVSRNALLLRTDRLPAAMPRREQLRQTRSALSPLAEAERSQWYDLPAGRVALSWKGEHEPLARLALDGVARMLAEQPAGASSMEELVQVFHLPAQGEALLAAALSGLPFGEAEAVAPSIPAVQDEVTQRPFEPAELDRLEQNLAGTDMSRFARRRHVSRFNGHTAQLAWEERTLSIPELIETVAPGRDARSDVWLFRRLTRVLDRRLLSILSNPGELRGAGPFSITLNVASVLSQEFLRFDAALPAALRSRVVISFLPADLASDAGAFAFARNFARGRSYRVCLRAVSVALLSALDLAALDLDYVQLIWSSKLAELRSLPSAGGAQWIVGQPCTQPSIEWGLKREISLFAMRPSA